MKLFATTLFLCISLNSISQKIQVNEIDKFTKQKRVETDAVTANIKIGLTTASTLQFSLRAVDSTCFINIIGQNFLAGTVGANSQMLLLLENDSTVSVSSTGIQTYELSEHSMKKYNHQYRIYQWQVEMIANSKLKSVRRYLTDGYQDLDIQEKRQEKLMKMAQVFLDAIK